MYINKDLVWQPLEQVPGFSKGIPNKLYSQRSPSLNFDTHPVILFWKQVWNMTEIAQFKKEK